MILNSKKVLIELLMLDSVASSAASPSYISFLKRGHAVAQIGGFWSTADKEQHININDLIGDQFTVTNQNKSNVVAGLGYYLDGPEQGRLRTQPKPVLDAGLLSQGLLRQALPLAESEDIPSKLVPCRAGGWFLRGHTGMLAMAIVFEHEALPRLLTAIIPVRPRILLIDASEERRFDTNSPEVGRFHRGCGQSRGGFYEIL